MPPSNTVMVLLSFSPTVMVSAAGSRPASASLTPSAKSLAFHDDSVETSPLAVALSSLSIFTDESTTCHLSSLPSFVPVFFSAILAPSLAATFSFSTSAAVKVLMLLSRQSAAGLSNTKRLIPLACQISFLPGRRTIVPAPAALPTIRSASTCASCLATT